LPLPLSVLRQVQKVSFAELRLKRRAPLTRSVG